MKTSSAKHNSVPQEPKSPPVPLESLEDIAWELWLLVELLAPVRRRLPNSSSQKLADYIKDRLIANSVALAKWKKARPELFNDSPVAARDVLPGENWTFPDHRTLAQVIEAERNSTRVVVPKAA
jgi:hypothetical protein